MNNNELINLKKMATERAYILYKMIMPKKYDNQIQELLENRKTILQQNNYLLHSDIEIEFKKKFEDILKVVMSEQGLSPEYIMSWFESNKIDTLISIIKDEYDTQSKHDN